MYIKPKLTQQNTIQNKTTNNIDVKENISRPQSKGEHRNIKETTI